MPQSESQQIARALRALYDTYKAEGVGIWLKGAKVSLRGESPLDLLATGRVNEFCAAVERLEGEPLEGRP